MFTKMELATNFNFTEELQDYYCLHVLLAPMKEKKVVHQAYLGLKCSLLVIIDNRGHYASSAIYDVARSVLNDL